MAENTDAGLMQAMRVAREFPRDPDAALERISKECCRIGVAEVGIYSYPRDGEEVQQPTLRLMEVVAQKWGNLRCGVAEVSRSKGFSDCKAFAVDTETGFSDEKDFQVRHWRETPKGGYEVTGDKAIYELVANMGARRKRACMQAVIPRDIVESAMTECALTLEEFTKNDDESVERMVARLGAYGVTPEAIEKRIQRPIADISQGHMVSLNRIYNSLAEGMVRPSDWFDLPDPDDDKAKSKHLTIEDLLKKSRTAHVVGGEVTVEGIRSMLTRAESVDELADIEAFIAEMKDDDKRVLYRLADTRRTELSK